MTRITAESIRARMTELQMQMALLEEFNAAGHAADLCSEHAWVMKDYVPDYSQARSLDGIRFHAYFVCDRCGVKVTQSFENVSGFDELTIVDPWADLRPEESSLLKATSEEE